MGLRETSAPSRSGRSRAVVTSYMKGIRAIDYFSMQVQKKKCRFSYKQQTDGF